MGMPGCGYGHSREGCLGHNQPLGVIHHYLPQHKQPAFVCCSVLPAFGLAPSPALLPGSYAMQLRKRSCEPGGQHMPLDTCLQSWYALALTLPTKSHLNSRFLLMLPRPHPPSLKHPLLPCCLLQLEEQEQKVLEQGFVPRCCELLLVAKLLGVVLLSLVLC